MNKGGREVGFGEDKGQLKVGTNEVWQRLLWTFVVTHFMAFSLFSMWNGGWNDRALD